MNLEIKRDEQRYALGSGYNYILADDGTHDTSTPEGRLSLAKALFTPEQKWGYTKNGATLTYTPTTQILKDDMGEIKETILTDETATLQIGHLTTGPDILKPMAGTAVISEVPGKEGWKEVSIGGIGNDDGAKYFFGFEHVDNKQGNTYIIVNGRNSGELSFQYQPESEMVIQPTITASAMDGSGRLIIMYYGTPGENIIEGE